MNVIETTGLGKCYGKAWALRDCTLAVPEGSLAALVGPNGAGKSTLMNMAVGLTVPTAGTATVLGGQATGSPAALDDIAFMAQDAPVYKNLSVADMLHLTRNLNRRFDDAAARARLADLGIPLKKKTGKLSGGQQAQVALTMALAQAAPAAHPRRAPVGARPPGPPGLPGDRHDGDDRRRRVRRCCPRTRSPSLSGSPTTSSCSAAASCGSRGRSTTCSRSTRC